MRRGDLFVLSWESLRRVEWGKVSSFLSVFFFFFFFYYFFIIIIIPDTNHHSYKTWGHNI